MFRIEIRNTAKNFTEDVHQALKMSNKRRDTDPTVSNPGGN